MRAEGTAEGNPQLRVGTNVTWSRPFGRHQIQAGGVFNYDRTTTNNESNANGAFVFTSNVDGQFGKAGYSGERVCEIHGSIHHLQCMRGCSDKIWPATDFAPEIDADKCLLRSALPVCPRCRGLARPNILMFGDRGWIEARQQKQYAALLAWLRQVRRPVIVEIGAGTAIPSVRHFGEAARGVLIRINPTEPGVPKGKGFGLRTGGLEGIRRLREALSEKGR